MLSEKVTRPHIRPNRPILFPSAPVSEGVEIRQGCQLVCSLVRAITGVDIAAWPYSVGILCKFTAFLGTLHWPMGSDDMGHLGVSFLELLILFEQWAGHRLLS